MTTTIERALAAGLIEGEGSVRLNSVTRKNNGALIVCMTNTNLDLVEFMQDRWPGSVRPATGLRPDQRPAWVWTLASRRALAFLDEIEPYAISERLRERIRTARWWQEIKSKHWRYRTEADYEEAFCCWHWMSELNRRGVAA